DARVDERLRRLDRARSQEPGDLPGAPGVGVGEGHRGDALEGLERGGVEGPDPAHTHDADVEVAFRHGSAYSKRLQKAVSSVRGRAPYDELGLEDVEHPLDATAGCKLEQQLGRV